MCSFRDYLLLTRRAILGRLKELLGLVTQCGKMFKKTAHSTRNVFPCVRIKETPLVAKASQMTFNILFHNANPCISYQRHTHSSAAALSSSEIYTLKILTDIFKLIDFEETEVSLIGLVVYDSTPMSV